MRAIIGLKDPIRDHLAEIELSPMDAAEPFENRFVRTITVNGVTPSSQGDPISPDDPAFAAAQTYHTVTAFLTEIERLLGQPLKMAPITVEFSESFDRGPQALPLSLEPDIDYASSTLRFSRRHQPSGMVSLSVLLHEVTHLLITWLIAPLPQRSWLAEALCDYLAAAQLGDPVLRPVEACPELYRSLAEVRRYPDDVQDRSEWLAELDRAVARSELSRDEPEVLAAIDRFRRDVETSAGGHEPQPHSIGLILGGYLWALGERIGHSAVRRLALETLIEEPQPSDPTSWTEALLRRAQRQLPIGLVRLVKDLAAERGFAPR